MIPVDTIPGIEVGGVKKNDGGNEFKYDIFDILHELLSMPQCTPIQHNNKK
jgi:hypothetical protein